jgi:periplasmic divalent cation tolerance protein
VDREQQLFIKTTSDRVDALWEVLRSRHPYDVPEFLVLPVVGGSEEYTRWVAESVEPRRES